MARATASAPRRARASSAALTPLDVVRRRLRTQHLAGPKLPRPADAVRWLVAAQSQDYGGARWSIAQRVRGGSGADVDREFASGAILRTHILRPTWHFVTPADIRWMQHLTAPRVHAQNAYHYRRLEIDAEVVTRSQAVFVRALDGGTALTREELATALERSGITAAATRLGYIVIRAELDALICSGPPRGKRQTYMLLEERAPRAKGLAREEALAEIVGRFFAGHGPATLGDLVWWSSLTQADARTGLELVRERLRHESLEGETYWYAEGPAPTPAARGAYFLWEYDESTIAYKGIQVLLPGTGTLRRANWLGVLERPIVVDGITVGSWRRTFARGRARLAATLFTALTPGATRALQTAAARYAKYLGTPVTLAMSRGAPPGGRAR